MKGATFRVRLWRAAYKAAWIARKGVRLLPWPHMNGAMAAVWVNGRVLLVQNSYNAYWSMPGGRLNAGESFAQAAARELQEETGIRIEAVELTPVHDEVLGHLLRRDRVEIFSAGLDVEPSVAADPVEIRQTCWVTPEEAFALPLFGPTRRYLQSL